MVLHGSVISRNSSRDGAPRLHLVSILCRRAESPGEYSIDVASSRRILCRAQIQEYVTREKNSFFLVLGDMFESLSVK